MGRFSQYFEMGPGEIPEDRTYEACCENCRTIWYDNLDMCRRISNCDREIGPRDEAMFNACRVEADQLQKQCLQRCKQKYKR